MDKNLTFHKAVAWMIIAASTMHIMAHYYNYERIAKTARPIVNIPQEGPRYPPEALPTLLNGVPRVRHVCVCVYVFTCMWMCLCACAFLHMYVCESVWFCPIPLPPMIRIHLRYASQQLLASQVMSSHLSSSL